MVIFVYLLDNETSWLIILGQGMTIVLEAWKITQASRIALSSTFPFILISDSETYEHSPTKEYDEIAMKYMSWAAYPILGCYTGYSILYTEHKSLYAFLLNTLVGCIYTFGFVNMTPQLYINYRLKSVEHMPSKALFYRFLNTIIDDLFSFVITMPTMHRISCFRDDIIFVVYLYQRYVYAVDQTRGMYATEKPEHVLKLEKEKEEAKEKAKA